jgi:hypothetical protein
MVELCYKELQIRVQRIFAQEERDMLFEACPPGLPDGIFSNQKYHFGLILEGLAMEDVGIFYGHLVYITVILYILWPFGICILWPFRICCGNLVYFMVIWYIFTKKNLATLVSASLFYHPDFESVKNE